MANDFLKHKWRLWFRILDVKGTGKFTKQDEERDERKYADLMNADPVRKAEIIKALQELTDEYYFGGKQGSITEQEFLDMQNEHFKAGKDSFKERMNKCFELESSIFENKDRMLTRESFVNAYTAIGHGNTERINKFFQSFGPNSDDTVPSQVVIDAWVLYTTNEDEGVKDVVREALEEGL